VLEYVIVLLDPRKHERGTVIGRYALYDVIASGGMATVHYGRLLGPVGFSRTVAVKRLHPQFAKDPEFVAMFIDEARLAARIRHPNVVQTLDVVSTEGELFLVMDYVQGESLSRLLRASRTTGPIPVRVASAILCGALHGLHAAHEATDEHGEALGIVHRDISPQNILVDVDGMARVLDFGVAKAAGRAQITGKGKIKGKLRYMAPEQIGGSVTRQSDVFSASVVLWEVLAGTRLFPGDQPRQVLDTILTGDISPPSKFAPHVPPELDAVVMRGLARDPLSRYATARDMAVALESCAGLASPTQVGTWVESLAQNALAQRAAAVAEIENSSSRIVDMVHLTPADAVVSAASSTPPVTRDASFAPSHCGLGASRPANDSFPRPNRRAAAWLLGGAILLGGVIALAAGLRRSAPSAPAVLSPSATSASIATSIPAASSVALEPAVRLDASSSPPVPSAQPSPRASSAPPAPAKTAAPWTAGAPARRPAATIDCTPPYALDAQGHKHWKDACFRR
jgi:serine/threonine protein kinase